MNGRRRKWCYQIAQEHEDFSEGAFLTVVQCLHVRKPIERKLIQLHRQIKRRK